MGVTYALVVDGGNSKTDVALVSSLGEVVGSVRGPGFRPQVTGVEGALGMLDSLVGFVDRPVAHVAAFLAGADLPEEEAALASAVASRGWASSVFVANDTFAVLRAGTASLPGVAVVCGTGINCVGVGLGGEQFRFPALGAISGDWGGGADVGAAALWHAARCADGRGPWTELAVLVPGHFGLESVASVTRAVHVGEIPYLRLRELAPLVLGLADEVAESIVDRLAGEIVAMAGAALSALNLTDCEVVLGGGILAAAPPGLLDPIRAGLPASVRPVVVSAPPLLGAGLAGLDALGAGPEAYARLRGYWAGSGTTQGEVAAR
ncbi:N-acetylglucosamine kinase [Nonomuraea sp. NPDC050556]|uniref:N-acetylglucosamine kinase n=1 Tax=Nonomuraea sp. NPDC050556 TaxID=3364369 RepID=UPI003794DAFB